MKKLLYLVLLAVGFTGCSVEESVDMDVQEVNLIDTGERCGDATTHYYENNLGSVEVSNDGTTLYCKITSNVPGALMNGMFAWAETFEDFGSNPGTLPPGKMDEKMDEHGVTTFTYEVPLSEISVDCILIAARSIFKANQGEHWAGNYTAGHAEWKYFQYCIQDCPPPPPVEICESAYARTDQDKTLSTFYKERNSNNWGWYNYVVINSAIGYQDIEIYAAAGQNDITKGTLVGHVRINYNGTYSFIPLENSDFTFANTHVYIGEKMPKTRLAPGHFARNSTAVAGGDFFVIVHLEVCAEEGNWD